jgi:hypothetical protein
VGGYADPLSEFADAAFEHIADTELVRDLLHVRRLVLVDEARIARDHRKPFDPRQAGDDFFHRAVGEVILLGVTAHVGERQNRNRGPVAPSRPGGRLARRGASVVGNPRGADRPDKSIASAGQRFDPAVTAGLLREHAAEGCDLNGQVAVFDRKAGPRRLD